jgi:hypothetical protein
MENEGHLQDVLPAVGEHCAAVANRRQSCRDVGAAYTLSDFSGV